MPLRLTSEFPHQPMTGFVVDHALQHVALEGIEDGHRAGWQEHAVAVFALGRLVEERLVYAHDRYLDARKRIRAALRRVFAAPRVGRNLEHQPLRLVNAGGEHRRYAARWCHGGHNTTRGSYETHRYSAKLPHEKQMGVLTIAVNRGTSGLPR